MLYVTENLVGGRVNTKTWHVGEPFPNPTSRVVTFQADGEELEIILNALNEKSAADAFFRRCQFRG